jgi:hypothetical protein
LGDLWAVGDAHTDPWFIARDQGRSEAVNFLGALSVVFF